MKQKYLKWIFALVLIVILTISNKVSASTYRGLYTIQNYDINMVVNENNTFDITETIKVNFNIDKHEIIREIPLQNITTRTNGTTFSNVAKVTNLKVNADYTTSKENVYEVIKIEDTDPTLVGARTYKISYTYDIGKDPFKDKDELYYNLIGDQWYTSISGLTFTIIMPKPFDKSTLFCSTEKKAKNNSSDISYNVSGNIINGTCSRTLNPCEGLTVGLTLPEGYFINTKYGTDVVYSICVIIICIGFTCIAYVLWSKYGKDDPVVETVEFYPPKGYNSAEIGLFYNGAATNKGVISLLIYLANKGYLKIEEIKGKGIFADSNGFKITKLKEYEEENEYEKTFFYGLFINNKDYQNFDENKAISILEDAEAKGKNMTVKEAVERSEDNPNIETSVTQEDLRNNFYIILKEIKDDLNSKENAHQIFEPSSLNKVKWIIGMITIILLLISIKPFLEIGDITMTILCLLFPLIGILAILSTLLQKSTLLVSKIISVICGICIGAVPWEEFGILQRILDNPTYLITNIIGLICIIILLVFVTIMPKRTKFGNEMLGKIRGFRRFLKTAEKPKLEALVKDNPEYFYNILPYTYALGVSTAWMKQFETIAMEPPEWYQYTGTYSTYKFNRFMNNTIMSAQSVMASRPPSSRGGSFSTGGGFSGGGSGGGGGSSW